MLQKAIDDIEQRIGVIDNEIEWVIFDEEDYVRNKYNVKMPMPSIVYLTPYKYGFCYIDTKQIYISTAAIRTSNVSNFKRRILGIDYIHEGKNVFFDKCDIG